MARGVKFSLALSMIDRERRSRIEKHRQNPHFASHVYKTTGVAAVYSAEINDGLTMMCCFGI